MARRRILDRYPEVESLGPTVTVLGEGMVFEGEVATPDHVRIAGRVEGPVRAGKVVVVLHGGVVKGPIEAEVIIIEGAVDGKCLGRAQFELGATGRIQGDVESPLVALADGAYLRGQVRTGERDPRLFVEHRRSKRPRSG
jgi:cytoskeletal protein CcmA (bactofilin family)